jgi:c-di-GMP-binding flagellar brake protein YcgR
MSDKNAQPVQQRRSMKSSAQLERRRFERAPITAQVEYELTNSSSGPSRVRRNMANISLGGMFITTEEPIRTGTRMVVRFELPNRHRVIAVSRVCYARKGVGLGVEFLNLDDEDREEIEAYIAVLRAKEELRA